MTQWTETFVYAIRVQRWVKLGYARQPVMRLSHIQCGSPFEATLHGYFAGGKPEERELHELFSNLRGRGEWFRAHRTLIKEFEKRVHLRGGSLHGTIVYGTHMPMISSGLYLDA